MKVIAPLVVSLSLLGASPASAALNQEALVIANQNYTVARQLKHPISDAAIVSDGLRARGFHIFQDRVVPDVPDYKSMKALVSDFLSEVSKSNADVVVIYYNGHGAQVGHDDLLVPTHVDADDDDDLSRESMSVSELMDQIRKANVKLGVVILDACRDDPFPGKSKSLGGAGKGLQRLDPPNGVLLWFATEAGTTASDGDGDHGPFATVLASRLQSARSESIDDFFHLTDWAVYNLTHGAQNPGVYVSNFAGKYVIADGSGQSEWIPFSDNGLNLYLAPGAPIQENARTLANIAFRDGLRLRNRQFLFGEPYATINSSLDSPLKISDYNSLVPAPEFKVSKVRYFWQPLSQLAIGQSFLLSLSPGMCIAPESYLIFLFNDDKLFQVSLRLHKTPACPSYSDLKEKLFGNTAGFSIQGDTGVTDVSWSEVYDWVSISAEKRGVVEAPVWN